MKRTINSFIVNDDEKTRYTLYDLRISVDTEVDIGVIIPLKIDIAKIDIQNANIAMSFLYKFKGREVLEPKKDIKHPTKIIVDQDKSDILFDFTDLSYAKEIDELDKENYTIEILKFVNFDIIDVDNEYDLYEHLLDNGFDTVHFANIFSTVNYYIVKVINEFRDKVKDILEIDNIDGKSYNMALLDLKSTYEHSANTYYPENIGKANSEWSFREVELNRSYWTKKTMIDNAINKGITDTPKFEPGGE